MSELKLWRTLEAAPEVLNAYSLELGVKPDTLEFVDVFDPADLAARQTLAVLFVYPITDKFENHRQELAADQEDRCRDVRSGVWFTRQTVGNACGTVALLHTFANVGRQYLRADGPLATFLAATEDMTPDERAARLASAEGIVRAHSAAAAAGQSHSRDDRPVVEHYVALIPWKDNCLVELDGRKTFPLVFEEPGTNFAERAYNSIRRRYFEVDPEESRYSLVALCTK